MKQADELLDEKDAEIARLKTAFDGLNDLCTAIRKESVERLERIEWLEGLFDFSDPEVVLHSGPNDPITKDAVVVLRSHYETKANRPRANPSGAATLI